MRCWLGLSFLFISISLSGQISTFPYSESFEETFTTGTDVSFITNWKGNTVANSNRIFQGSDARTSASSLNIIPISSFSGELQVALNLTGVNNPKISFYAYSKKNGSSSSSRPVILKFSTSIDGGATFLDEEQIGDDSTFPNDNSTSYTNYQYELPAEATNSDNVIVKITATRGSGKGSAAELIMDDFLIESQNLPLALESVTSHSSNSVEITFNQGVTETSISNIGNYTIDKDITIYEATLTASNQVTLTTSELSNAEYSIVINNIISTVTNTSSGSLTATFSFIQSLSINELQILNKNTLQVEFNLPLEKQSAENSLNYSLNLDGGIPTSAELLTGGKTVRLSFSNALDENEYTLNINRVRDESTLTIASDLKSTFSYLPLRIDTLIVESNSKIVVTFNKNISEASATESSNYQIDKEVIISGTELIAPNQVAIITSPLSNGEYMLILSEVKDDISITDYEDLTKAFSFIEPLSITNVEVKDRHTIEVVFNLDLDKISAENPLHYQVDLSIENPISTELLSAKNTVNLTFASALDDNDYELTINGVKDESTLAEASALTAQFSYLPIKVDAILAKSDTEIEITFNQEVDSTSGTLNANYSINYGIGNPKRVVRSGSSGSKVTITLAKPMVNNTYVIIVDSISNKKDNARAEKLSAEVRFETITHPRQIVINEIFADPSGEFQPEPKSLPNQTTDEFVELYNTTDNAIDLEGFELSGGRINQYALAPKAYVILTSNNNIPDFEGFGDVVGVTSWNTLTNGGEQLLLKDNIGNTVDSLSYNLGWYKNNEKAEGGWSIAQINPELLCSDIDNWLASIDISGGTPGRINSIFDTTPDTKAPNLVSIMVHSDQALLLHFDELMDAGSLSNARYTLDNGVAISSIGSAQSNTRSIVLYLDQPMTSGLKYTLSVLGATDCIGNEIAINESTFLFDNLPPVLERIVLKDSTTIDLIFNEDVSPSSSENYSNYNIQPLDMSAIKATLNDTDSKRVRLSLSSGLSIDSVYTLIYQHLTDTLGNVIDSASFGFDFENEVDTVIVISNHLIDLYLKKAPNLESAENRNNYQVDKDINQPETVSLDRENGKLLHLIFNNNFPENRLLTLDFENLFDTEGNSMQLLNSNFLYDTDDPNVDSVVVLDENSLQVYFDEPLDITSAESINNYQINAPNQRPFSATLSNDRESVILTFSIDFIPEEIYRLTLTGIADISGNHISANRNYNFVFDLLAPTLVEFKILSPKVVSLQFSEALNEIKAINTTNYIIDNDIGQPNSVKLVKSDPRIVTLEFDSLNSNMTNTLEVNNLSDLRGNTIDSSILITFSTEKPTLGSFSILSDTSIQVQFSKVISQSPSQEIGNYGFNDLLNIGSILQDENDGSIVKIILTAPMDENIDYTFSASNLIGVDGSISQPINHSFSYVNAIENIEVLNQNSLVIDFNTSLSEEQSENTNNYIINQQFGHPLSAVWNTDKENQVTLLFKKTFQNDQQYELRAQNLKDEFENGIPSSPLNFIYDISPPEVIAVNSIYLNEIAVVFNEPIDPNTSQTLNHYLLNEEIKPIDIQLSEHSRNTVLLSFLDDLMDGSNQTLSVKRVLDTQGNEIMESHFSFTFEAPDQPLFRDIVINEVYFDTDQDAQLPNREFIEIYNNSDKNFLLTDFAITDRRDTALLPSVSIAADGHLILTNTAGANDYSSFGNTLGISRFPSLSNTGETIFLLDRNYNIVDSLSYDQSYYNDTHKQDGGFTIELINPQKHCFDVGNYHASKAGIGGTPGVQNSVFDDNPDTDPPIISSLKIITPSQISVTFNEAMNIGSITQEKFQLSNEMAISNIHLVDHFGKEVLINLAVTFYLGETHTMSILGVTDCSENLLSDTTLNFSQGATPQAGELIFTEIMASPIPSQGLPEAEYLEVLNVSSKIISLKGVTLSDAVNSTTLDAIDLNPNEYLILAPTATANQFSDFGHALAVNSWPSLNNASDKISLHNALGIEVFSIQYDDTWYRSVFKAEGGFSIEMIDIEYPCLLETNWTGSENTIGGSPGTLNSVNGDNPDLQGPEILTAISIDQSTIQIDFNERLNSSSIELDNFNTDHGLSFIALSIHENEKSVTLTTDVDLAENTVYQISTNNITDCSGNLVNSSNNSVELIVAGKAEPLDVLINEILFNPKSDGVRFVEIYNNSHKYINLKDWKISGLSNQKPVSEENHFMEPASFLTITNDGDILFNQYPNAKFETFKEISSMPSMPSDAGSVFISDENDITIDSLEYNEDYHTPLISNYDGISLERVRISGISNDPSNWFSAASTSNNATPGYENSQSRPLSASTGIITVDPQTFAPDIPGLNNFTTINYSFDTPGNVVNVKILSADGKQVKLVAQNAVAGTEGFFRWDGITSDGIKARIGYYMIIFEITSLAGKISYLLDKVAIGSRFEPK